MLKASEGLIMDSFSGEQTHGNGARGIDKACLNKHHSTRTWEGKETTMRQTGSRLRS